MEEQKTDGPQLGLNALLSCPFCGSQPVGVVDTVTAQLEIACVSRLCWVKPKVVGDVGVADRLWNTRSDAADTERLIDGVTNLIDVGIRKSLYGTYTEWQDAVASLFAR